MKKAKTTTCKVCGEEIAKSAKSCPHCGAKIKPPKIALVIIAVCFAVILICVIIAAVGEGADQPENGNKKTEYNIGDTATIGDFELTVSSYNFSDYMGGDGLHWDTAKEGNQYLNVIVSVTNKGVNTADTAELFFSLLYDQQYNYSSRYGSYHEFYYANSSLIPLASLENKIVSFEIPSSIATDSKQIELVISNGTQSLFGGYSYDSENDITYRLR